MGKKNSALDVDTLIENVRREAAARMVGGPKDNVFQPVDLGGSAELPQPRKSAVSEFKVKSRYYLDEFLQSDDLEFLTNAYRGILHREPDNAGQNNYLALLRKGVSKPVILAYLMRSPEGKQQGVAVHGMRRFLGIHKLLRHVGPVGRWVGRRTDRSSLGSSYSKRRINDKLLEMEQTQHANMQQLTDVFADQFRKVDDQFLEMRNEIAKLTDAIAEQNKQFEPINVIIAQQEQRTIERSDHLSQSLTDHICHSEVKFDKLTQTVKEQQAQVDYLASPSSELPRFAREIDAIRQQLIDDQRSREQLLADLLKTFHGTATEQNRKTRILQEHTADRIAVFYRAFEDECRGTLEDIRKNLSVYIPGVKKTVTRAPTGGKDIALLDIGCGRGEWLGLLGDSGIKARGVDLNPMMTAHCHSAGLDVVQADAVDYLKTLPDETLSAVTGFHIVEHLSFDILFALFDQAQRVLRPGGMILFETPNPENVLVGSHTFYHDPTHRNPITPTFIQFLARYCGFTRIEIKRLHPYPESAKVAGHDPLTERVNGHLCGPQDYSIIAHKPTATPSKQKNQPKENQQ